MQISRSTSSSLSSPLSSEANLNHVRSLFLGKRVALALSGGRDSMCLFELLCRASVNFFAVHVEHGIRGDESVSDMNFVQKQCAERGVECRVFPVDAPSYSESHSLTLEQAARDLRYGVFNSLLSASDCDCIALAHHASDQAETMLMRILRGTGVKGLVAMREVSGAYYRPLLSFTREQIDDFVFSNSIPYVEDCTNADTAYTRNFLRSEFKSIKSRYPTVESSFARLSASALEAEDFISLYVPNPVLLSDGAVSVDVSDLAEPAIGKRLIFKALSLLGVNADVETKHLSLLLSLAKTDAGKRLDLTHGVQAFREDKRIVFVRSDFSSAPSSSASFNAPSADASVADLSSSAITDLSSSTITDLSSSTITDLSSHAVTASPSSFVSIPLKVLLCDGLDDAGRNCYQSPDFKFYLAPIDALSPDTAQTLKNVSRTFNGFRTLFIDADKLSDNAVLRLRSDGDVIAKFGGGRKSLGDFLTDKKVPLRLRDSLTICADGQDVEFVAGVEISSSVKVDSSTSTVLVIEPR